MITLQNEQLKVLVKERGAELCSIRRRDNDLEYLWQADPDVWAYHAPNLFPVVGGCKDNKLIVNGTMYPIQRHGFARYSTFTVQESRPDHAKFSLHYSPETFESYPYRFEFQVLYDLADNGLRVSYKVLNLDDKDIYFSVGAHPAFKVPIDQGGFEDYYIEFEQDEVLQRSPISEGYFSGDTQAVELNAKRLYLKRELFAEDAQVFKSLRSRKVLLASELSEHSVEVDFEHFTMLGLWTMPGADYLCIEPWLGCGDNKDGHSDISQKEGIRLLEKGHVFEVDYTIKIN